jgi:tetratricopeptide (TPR) repeat protein
MQPVARPLVFVPQQHFERESRERGEKCGLETMSMIDSFEAMLASGQDNSLLRYSLGTAYLKEGDTGKAIAHLEMALQKDPDYSAAWKIYGKALTEAGRIDDAISAYEKGIEVAEGRGDKQASKEMSVFHKRLVKQKSGEE